MGVTGFSEGGVLGGGTHREFVLIHPAKGNGPGGSKFLDDGGVVWGDVVFEKLGATSAGLAEHVHVVLDANGDTSEGQGKIGIYGLGEGTLEIMGEISAGLRVAGGDFSSETFKNGSRGSLTGDELLAELSNGHFG